MSELDGAAERRVPAGGAADPAGAGSLADQAAAWIPPWLRPRPVEPAPAAPADPEPAAPADPEPAAPVAPEPDLVDPAGVEVAEPASAEPTPVDTDTAEPAAVEPAPTAPVPAEPVAVEPVAVEPVAAAAADIVQLAGMDDDELRAALEAIILVVDEPVTEIVLAQVLEQPTVRIAGALAALATEYTDGGRGFDLRRVAGGWRLYTRPEFSSYVERFVLDGQQVRLTQAALETLAVVAYKQPVTRSRISAIRGVNCDGVVRTLVARGLIEVTGTEPETGAFLYRTTTLFLEKLGVDGVDQLPPLAPFLPDDVEEVADAQR